MGKFHSINQQYQQHKMSEWREECRRRKSFTSITRGEGEGEEEDEWASMQDIEIDFDGYEA